MLRKSLNFDIKSLDEDSYIIEGYASIFGNIDRAGDIVLPGAFTNSLPAFLEDGVICYQHETNLTIGKPLDAKEDDHGLWFKAQLIKEIEAARDCFALMKAGVIKKFSFGYDIVASEWLYTDNLETYLGADYRSTTSMADITKALDWGRALKTLDLYEISPVSIPCNPKADLTSVKSGLRAGLRFDEFADATLAVAQEFAKDAKEIRAIRSKEGRTLSESSRTRLKTVRDALGEGVTQLDTILAETDPQKGHKRRLAAFAQALELEAEIMASS
jgi:HK97 family phage prohead protease